MKDKSYNFIRMVATLMILIYHLLTTFCDNGLIDRTGRGGDLNLGGIGVAIFFMLSGALLIKKYRHKCEVGKFYKKRLIRIYLPHWICYTLFLIVTVIMHPDWLKGVQFHSVLISFFALDFFAQPLYQIGISTFWLVGEWFTTVILILYLLFPLLRWLYTKHKLFGTIILTILFVVNLKFQILTYGGGWFSITNGLMCFWIGMVLEDVKKYYKGWGCFALLGCLMLLFISVNPSQLFGFYYIPTFVFSVLLFLFMTNINISFKFCDFVCKYNFDIYLVHHRVYILLIPILLPYMTNNLQIVFYSLLMIWLIFGISKISHFITDLVLKLCTKLLKKININRSHLKNIN